MQRMTAALMIALTPCLIAKDDRAIPQQSPSDLNIVLRVSDPFLLGGACAVTFRIGGDGTGKLAATQPDEASLIQYLESLCEAARYALFKQLHMA